MRYTIEEYWSLEAQSNTRYEDFDGEIAAVKPAGITHNLLATNLMMAIRSIAKQHGCRVFKEGIRLAVQQGKQYAYPDIASM